MKRENLSSQRIHAEDVNDDCDVNAIAALLVINAIANGSICIRMLDFQVVD
jgi:hypothetical protein